MEFIVYFKMIILAKYSKNITGNQHKKRNVANIGSDI